jgi:hypothetical protein
MALNDQILNVGANAMRSAMAWVSLHSAMPSIAGSNETLAPRRPSAWAAPQTGDLVSASINFTGGASNGPIKAVGFWDSENGGTFWGYYGIATGDDVFNASGQYTLAAFTLAGTSS